MSTPQSWNTPSGAVSRRSVLIGGASLALLAACGGDDADGSGQITDPVTDTPPEFNLLALFPPTGLLVPGVEQRIAVALADADGVPLADPPAELDFVLRADGEAQDPVTVGIRDEGVPTPYYPVRFTADAPATYEVTTTVEGEELIPRAFEVNDPSMVPIPLLGEPLPPVDTPTVAEPAGVDPICTRNPPCPFHEVSLTDALGAGGPVALAIATPEFCQTAICGPVIEIMMDAAPDYPDVTFVHAEVYANPRAVSSIAEADLAPAVSEYQMSYEPALFLADGTGTLIERLDTAWDASEMREELDRL